MPPSVVLVRTCTPRARPRVPSRGAASSRVVRLVIDAPVDLVEAFGLLSNAASRGVPRAMHNLAIMYHRGLGTPKNLSEAMRLYERAATAGEVLAQLELARMFASGTDVPRDDRIAAGWYASIARLKGRVDEELVDEAEAFLAKG